MADLEDTFVGDKSVLDEGEMKTPLVKSKKLGLKMVSSKKSESTKKKRDLNISKLKSVGTPKSMSLLNMSAQKLTLRANNRSLAQKLAKTQQDLRQVTDELKDKLAELQEVKIELNHYKRVAGLKEENVEKEVTWRIQNLMNEMKMNIEELTQKMIDNSVIINNMHNKCLLYTRRSLDRSRGSSFGNDSVASTKDDNQSTQSVAPTKQKKSASGSKISKSCSSLASYLAKSDECMAPTLTNLPTLGADMSLIAEQSIIGEEEEAGQFEFTAQRLSAVTEISGDTPEAPAKEPVSRLPQRIRRSLDNPPNISNNKISTNTVPNSTTTANTTNKTSANTASNTTTNKSTANSSSNSTSNKKSSDLASTRTKEKLTVPGESKSKTDASKKETMPPKEKKNENDHGLDCDISSFGFGGNFADELVSGSPISSPKAKEKPKEKEAQPSLVPPKIVVSSTESDKTSEKKANITKSNSSKPISSKSSKNIVQKQPLKASSANLKPSVKPDSKLSKPTVVKPNLSKSKKDVRRRSIPIHRPSRSPVKEIDPNLVENPFKPTKVLLRSPVHSNSASNVTTPEGPAGVVPVLDSQAFIAMLKEKTNKINDPLPEPAFAEEPTRYFNADMELTSVIDTSKLTLPIRTNSNKSSPILGGADVKETLHGDSKQEKPSKTDGNGVQSNAKTKSVEEGVRTRHASGKDKKDKDAEKKAKEEEEDHEAAVEVRNKKPGVFTFSVPRKDKDGTRKPVPEKTSTARSKKKAAPVTPEKDPHRTGPDRDMFNFGDRTPTMPLEVIVKTKTVYDLTMNESTLAPSTTLNTLREKDKKDKHDKNDASKESTTKKDEHIYYMPLKGCDDDEPANAKSRSKSTTRSRSKSRSRKADSDNDDDWSPSKQSKARSKSTTRSKSKTRSKKQESEDEEEVDSSRSKTRSKSTTRSKSKSRQNAEDSEAECERPVRAARSKARYVASDEEEEEEKEQLTRPSRSRSKKKKVEDDTTAEAKAEEEAEENTEAENAANLRQSRSRSRARNKEENLAEAQNECKQINASASADKDEKVLSRSKSKTALMNQDINGESECVAEKASESEKVSNSDATVYSVPLKDSPVQDKPKARRGRSRSRSRKESENEKVTEEQEAKTSRGRSRSRARKGQTTEDAEEVNEIAEKSSRRSARSRSRAAKDREILSVAKNEQMSKDLDKSNREPEVEKTSEKTNEKTVEKKSSLKQLLPADSESDEDETVLKSRRMSRKRIRSARLDRPSVEDSIVEPEPASEKKSKSRSKVVKSKEPEVALVPDSNSDAEAEGNEVSCVFNFVTKSRGRNVRSAALQSLQDDVDGDDAGDEGKKEIDEMKDPKQNDVKDEDDEDRIKKPVTDLKTPAVPEVPTTRTKKSAKTTSKSVRKSKKQVDDLETPHISAEEKLKRKPLEDEDVNQSEETRSEVKKNLSKSTKTPAGSQTARSKKAKTASRSSRKVQMPDDVEPTPKGKVPKSSKKITDKENDTPEDNLAKMKRKLILMTAKSTESLIQSSPTKKSRASDEAAELEDDDKNDDRATSRRRKQPVSYAPPKLNTKMRREDFLPSAEYMSKAKAENARISLAMKTGVHDDDL